MGDGKGKGLKSLLRNVIIYLIEADLKYTVCVCMCVGAVVMEIRLSKNLAHQMDKH